MTETHKFSLQASFSTAPTKLRTNKPREMKKVKKVKTNSALFSERKK